MNKGLIALVIVEGIVIVVLAALVFLDRPAATGPAAPSPSPGGGVAESESDGVAVASRPARGRRATASAAPTTESRLVATPYSESPEQEYAADDPLGIVLFGAIRARNGQPVSEARVTILDEDTGEYLNADVGKRQGYAISGLKPGPCKFTVRAAGFRSLDQPLTIEPTPVRQRLDATLDAAVRIKVKVLTPDGTPIADALRAEKMPWGVGVTVIATRTRPTQDLPATDQREAAELSVGGITEGGFGAPPRLPKEYLGTIELRCDPPVFVSAVVRNAILATQEVSAPVDEITFHVSVDAVKQRLCTFKVKLVDAESGSPITSALVGLNDRQTGGPGQKVDANGSVQIENVRPGLLRMSIDGPSEAGFERVIQTIRFAPGETVDLGVLRLNKAVTIEGTLIDKSEKPVSGNLTVLSLDRRDPTLDFETNESFATEADGKFKISRVGRGRYLIRSRGSSGEAVASTIVDTSAGPVTGARLQLVGATRVILDVRPNPQSIVASSIVIEDSRGAFVTGRRIYSVTNGNFGWTLNLVPGSYTVRVYADRTEARATSLVVGTSPMRVPVDVP